MAGVYDVVVIGAGIEGSSTAYQLAKRRKKVLLLDQFPLPHTRGSSNGHTRITRKAYGEHRFYTEMAEASSKMIEQLENESGETIFINSGCLVIAQKNDEILKSTEACFKSFGIPYEKFDAEEQRRRYPNMTFPENYQFLLDKSGGVLMADRMLRAYHTQIKSYGGNVRDGERMVDVTPGTTVTVKTSKGVYTANSVVLALGPWAARFLPRIGVYVPLKPIKVPVFYWREKSPGAYDNYPAFASRDRHAIYGIPAIEYPGLVKLCHHNGPEVNPDDVSNVDSQWVLNKMTAYVGKHFPSLESHPSVTENCMYTMTPDGHYVLDSHPKWNNIIIGAGFSGHGFKLAPVVGCILADLATGTTPRYDVTPFAISRFKSKL